MMVSDYAGRIFALRDAAVAQHADTPTRTAAIDALDAALVALEALVAEEKTAVDALAKVDVDTLTKAEASAWTEVHRAKMAAQKAAADGEAAVIP